MRARLVWPLVLGLVPSLALAAPRSFSDGTVDIGVLYDGPWEAEAEITAALQATIAEVVGDAWTIKFPEELAARGDWTQAGVQKALDGLQANPKVDLIITTGPVGSHLLAKSAPRKPSFAGLIVDPAIQGLPAAKGRSGVKNLDYLALPTSVASDLRTLVDLAPAEQIAVLVAAPLATSLDPAWKDRLAAAAPEGTTLTVVEVSAGAQAVSAIGPDVDSVYITPLPNLVAAERDVLAAGLLERKLPALAMYGADWVDRGLLAARPLDSVLPAILRRLGLNIERTLNGDDPGELSVVVDARPPLLLDVETARAIGASPGWDILAEAILVSGAPDESTRTSLQEAVREMLVANVDLAAAAQVVEEGQSRVAATRAPVLPQLDLTADVQAIDPDLAAASFGMIPQYWGRAALELNQVILDDSRFASVASEKSAQESRVAVYEGQSADAIVSGAGVYLAVLRARAQEDVERSNLEVTRKNLDLARVRERVGAASPAEVHRWEVEVTVDQRSLLGANTTRRSEELSFNRTLSRPLDEYVLLGDEAIVDTAVVEQSQRLIERFEDPLGLERLALFLVDQAVRNSPEVAALEATIDSVSADLAASKRSYFVPTIGLTGRASLRMFWAGEGKDGGDVVPPEYESPDAFSWFVGANARLPLIEGGGRSAEVKGQSAQVAQARLDREAEVQRVDEGVRAALVQASSSWRALALAQEGAESAHLALDATTVSYSVGSASVLELLDAQDVTLESDIATVDAAFAFHLDLFDLMRSANRFLFLETEEDRAAFFDAMDAFMAGEG